MHPINSKSFGQTGILCLFSDSGKLLSGWIKKQVGTSRYLVTDGTTTKVCTLAQNTSDANTLPDGTCTFVLNHAPNTADENVSYLNSTRCSTTQGNRYAWHTGLLTSSLTRLVNNMVYYNIEQGLIHAAPISGGTIGASFSLTSSSKIRVRLPLAFGEDFGEASFTLTLHPDDSTSPNLDTVLATQTFTDAVLSIDDPVLLDFTNVWTVSLSPGRYWILLTDNFNSSDPVVSSGAAWFWDSNVVDATVKNEYNYFSFPSPAVATNISDTTAFQMCIEAIGGA